MTEFSWAQLATGVGAFFAIGMIVVTLKAVFGPYWTNLINRVVVLVLSLAIPPLAVWAIAEQTNNPLVYGQLVLAFLNGFLVAGSLLGVNELYRAKLAREQE